MSRPFRRNDVVIPKRGGSYGRVWRVLAPDILLVITSGKHIAIFHPDDLVRDGYQGYYDNWGAVRQQYPVFRRMPSLRQLMLYATGYNPDIWKKGRTGLPYWTHREGRYENMFKKEYQLLEWPA